MANGGGSAIVNDSDDGSGRRDKDVLRKSGKFFCMMKIDIRLVVVLEAILICLCNFCS